jgi:hypothetical protein
MEREMDGTVAVVEDTANMKQKPWSENLRENTTSKTSAKIGG